MGSHSAAFPPRPANPFRALLWSRSKVAAVALCCLSGLACSQGGPKIEVVDFDSPTPAVKTPQGTPFPPHPSPEVAINPVPSPSISPPRRRPVVEPHFGPPPTASPAPRESPGGDAPKGGGEALWLSPQPLQAAPTEGQPQRHYELPASSQEVYLGLNLRRRSQKTLLKATCYPPSGAPMVDSQMAAAGGAHWAEFSFARPAQGWTAGDYKIEVSASGKVLGSTVVAFAGGAAPKAPSNLQGTPPGAVILSHLPEATASVEKIPGTAQQVFLNVESGKSEAGTPFRVSWSIVDVAGQPKGKVLFEKQLEATGEPVKFTFDIRASSTGFYPGLYCVELQVAGKLVYQQIFSIEASH